MKSQTNNTEEKNMTFGKFPALDNWEPTHQTLHWYSKAVSIIPRTYLEQHPKWWHISLKVQPEGLTADEIPLPGGGNFTVKMDLVKHAIVVATSKGDSTELSMTAGLSASKMGDQLIAAVADLGLSGEYMRETFEDDGEREYDPAVAENFLTAINSANQVFNKHRDTVTGEDIGPVQLWPHGFDLAFELFGTKQVEYEENGEMVKYPSQLNLGFSLGEASHTEPYFYSNPWPFEDSLTSQALPEGARWFTDSWKGTMLPYAEIAGDAQAGERVLAYAQRVYEVATPTLME